MAKRRRKDKELTRLRREVEVLRAQLAGQGDTRMARETRETGKAEPEFVETPKTAKEVKKAPKPQPIIQSVDPKFIKADLLKSGILTLLAFGVIIALTIIL